MNDSSRILKVLEDFQSPVFYWQLLILGGCLSLAWVIARQLRARAAFSLDGMGLLEALAEQAFPLLAVLFLSVVRGVALARYPAHLFNIVIPLLLSLAVVRALRHMLRRSFPRAWWLERAGQSFSVLVWVWLALFLSGAAPEVIAALETVGVRVGAQDVNLWMLVNGVVVIVLTLLLSLWFSSLVENRLMGAANMDTSLRIVLSRMCKAVFVVLALLVSLSIIGLDITALSVFTGALGVGLGMGLQKIASNYVSGFIILLDRSIRLGNIIQVDSATGGRVTQITTRYTVLKNLVGLEFIVPNEALVSNIVQNQTFSDNRARVVACVSVAYSSDLDRVLALLEEIAGAHPRVLADPAPGAQIVRFADSGIDLELGFWINDPENGTGGLRSQIHLEIWRRFRAEGIEIPFPQREVRMLGGAAA
ncbi:MAG: mechanosensitive ion channel [Zoogloeaceae bacterium]|jgi:small-conductance mechanosensitive channel|nr:mechanosensitive ion channel [Zoogloeaceae bacterium]